MALAGAATDNTGENTHHSAPGVGIGKAKPDAMNCRIKKLWSRKGVMIIDEISMMDLTAHYR